MKLFHGVLGLAVICLAVIGLSLSGAVIDFTSHLGLDIDGILLLLTCLTMGGLFALMLLLIAKEQGWLPARKKKESVAPPAAPVKAPANPASGDAK